MLTLPPAALRAGLSQIEAASLLGVTRRTLNNWRQAGFGPQPIRDGRRLLYDRGQVEAFRTGVAS